MEDMFDEQTKIETEKQVAIRVNAELAKMIADPDIVISAYQKKLEETKAKLAVTTTKLTEVSKNYNTLVDIGTNYEMRDAAKLIKFIRSDGKQVGRNQLFSFLIDMGVLCQDNSPMQSYIDRKWFDIILEKWDNPSISGVFKKTVVTLLGIEKIRDMLESSFETWWEK